VLLDQCCLHLAKWSTSHTGSKYGIVDRKNSKKDVKKMGKYTIKLFCISRFEKNMHCEKRYTNKCKLNESRSMFQAITRRETIYYIV